LSLGVYATSWSFYGSVGFARDHGFNFLAIYLGVTLAFVLVPVLLAPLLRLARDYQLSSLADVLAFRYRSQAAGVLVTLFMLCGAFPYIALQIIAVTESIRILTQEATPRALALGFCLTLIWFAILFGARHISPREKHEGLVAAIAFESLVKLFALGAVGLFALFGVFAGPADLNGWLIAHPEALEALYAPVREGPWGTLILLSFCAAFLLPRQFHMTFAENNSERALFTASWAFPLLLLLLNVFIPVILWAGSKTLPSADPDFYVLGITLASGSRLLPAVAFIGGLSAASAMLIVTTLALASMCLNHLLLPMSYPATRVDLYRWLLWARRTLIAVIILAGYAFYLLLEANRGLVQLGLISFVAVAQFLPGVVGVLYWPRATRTGFLCGLIGGGTVWALTLLMPLLRRSDIIGGSLDVLIWNTPPGIDHWTFTTLTSLAVNGIAFFAVSMLTHPSPEERQSLDACRRIAVVPLGGVVLDADSPAEFEQRLARILGGDAARLEVGRALNDLAMRYDQDDPGELRRLRERIERNLSGLMGPMLARMIVDERLQTDVGTRSALADNIRLIEERVERSQTRLDGVAAELDRLRRYHRQILQDLPLGVCAIGADHRVVSWNLAMEVLSKVSRHSALGTPLERLPAPWPDLIGRCIEAEDQHLHKVQTVTDGTPSWFNLHKAAIDDPAAPRAGRGTVILVEDLSDLHTLEAELAHSERLASVGRLAAGVAHEIGNPVTGIACLAQNLESETEDPEVRGTSRQIIEQARRIGDIVQTLVGFSHGGTLGGEPARPTRLRQCVDEATRLVRLAHAAKQLDFENRCPATLLVHGDHSRLIQVFVNLLTNACDASRPGDRVRVEAAPSADQALAEITVNDNGEGIPEHLLDKVCEPFVTTKPAGRGTGLGLALVYRIIKEHAGDLRISSSPGRGTTVTVRLPLARDSAPESTFEQVLVR